MVPTIEPTLTVPLEGGPTGVLSTPSMCFAGDPPALYYCTEVWNDPPTKILWWHAPTVAAAVLPFALLAFFVCVRRYCSRARERGRLYCRGCNHELSVDQATLDANGQGRWATETSRCPECGRRSVRGPVKGSSRARRAVPMGMTGVFVLASSIVLAVALKPMGARNYPDPTWPWRGLEKSMGSWALVRRMSVYGNSGFKRIVRVPLDSGKPQILLRDQVSNWAEGFISPDGKYVLNVPFQDCSKLHIMRAESGQRRTIEFGAEKFDLVRPVGFSKDNRIVYAQFEQRMKKGPHQLFAVELESGARTLLAEVQPEPQTASGRNGQLSPRYVVQEIDGTMRWALLEMPLTGGTIDSILSIPNGTSIARFPFRSRAQWSSPVHWLPDGRRIEIANDFGLFRGMVLDTQTGQAIDQVCLFPFGGEERGMYVQTKLEGHGLMSKRGKEIGILGGAGDYPSDRGFAVSPDGRWAAAYVDVTPNRRAGIRTDTQAEIWVWDLSKLPPIEPESPAKQ